MTVTTFLNNGGTEGATATAGNTGCTTVVTGTGTTQTKGYNWGPFDIGLHVITGVGPTGNSGYCEWATPTPGLNITYDWYFLAPTTVFAANKAFFAITGGTSGTPGTVARANWSTTGTVIIQGAAFSGTTTMATAGVLTPGAWYRATIRLMAATATTGKLLINIYPVFGTAAQIATAVATFTSTTYNCGTDVITKIATGIFSAGANADEMAYGPLRIDDAQSTTEIAALAISVAGGSAVIPIRDYSATGGPVKTGSMSSFTKCVGDASAGTAITFPASDGSTARQVRMVLPGFSSTPSAFVPTVTQHLLVGGTGTFQLKLWDGDGTSLRKTWTLTPATGATAPQVLTGLSGGELASVTDWSKASLELAMV